MSIFFFVCALLFLSGSDGQTDRERDRESERGKNQISFIRYCALGVPIAWRHAWATLSPPQQCFSFCWSVIIVPRHILRRLNCRRCLCGMYMGARFSSVSPVRFFFYLVSSLTSIDPSHPLSSCPSLFFSFRQTLSHTDVDTDTDTHTQTLISFTPRQKQKKKNSRTLECVIREDQLGAGGRSGMQKQQQKARNGEPTAIVVLFAFIFPSISDRHLAGERYAENTHI